ncbi:hypothetical protein AYI68_g1796 [Smittium mucronatum]|uniref:Uncharacterized protein n=1 Tax=Smittium mucronatum TaxID=133383 RepID=A0A1R0H4H0_9FUNG|nr:hypothetical protein AYI68_g1796 [Smittium mucronatum]
MIRNLPVKWFLHLYSASTCVQRSRETLERKFQFFKWSLQKIRFWIARSVRITVDVRETVLNQDWYLVPKAA